MRNTYNRVFYGFPFKKKIDRKKKRKRRFEIREEVEEKERKKEEKRERKRIRKMDKRDFLLAINLMVMFVGYSCYSSVIPFLALTMEVLSFLFLFSFSYPFFLSFFFLSFFFLSFFFLSFFLIPLLPFSLNN